MQFHFYANQSRFYKNGFVLMTRFETEAQGNLEMAPYLSLGDEFHLHESEHAAGTHFHCECFLHEDSFWHRDKRQLRNANKVKRLAIYVHS